MVDGVEEDHRRVNRAAQESNEGWDCRRRELLGRRREIGRREHDPQFDKRIPTAGLCPGQSRSRVWPTQIARAHERIFSMT
jgi:hypothetical protein